tara:strand:+ start:193 stop:360 length:168 start_codon:yes stop_codon:yes gene_type:complete
MEYPLEALTFLRLMEGLDEREIIKDYEQGVIRAKRLTGILGYLWETGKLRTWREM